MRQSFILIGASVCGFSDPFSSCKNTHRAVCIIPGCSRTNSIIRMEQTPFVFYIIVFASPGLSAEKQMSL